MSYDEQPDPQLHGECAHEIARLTELLQWAYSKLHNRPVSSMDDAMKLDEIKLLLEHGI